MAYADNYKAGTGGGTVEFNDGKLNVVFSINCYAHDADGTLQIDGGDIITIRSGIAYHATFNGMLRNPVIVMSESIDYVIECGLL